ncbi:hypothetical protein FOCC_FOCC008996 [Frankliniella occidentalis]|nr:hypothetical protein FOCC_FOCC008996 [Frankliniella occidentalis]
MGAGALKTSRDILALWGYPHEQHKALTEDGYILSLDRIPNPGRPPVYMATPYIASATVFLNLGKGRALGFLLFDAGYDVWMINPRGSAYSTQHVRLDVDDPEYWNFHEHAVYDHPACVDTILAKTGYRQVIWAGFSLGSLTFLAMAALRPDYGQKVSAAFLMAPSTTQFYNPGIFLSLIKTAVKAEPLVERLESVVFPHALVRGFQQVACRGEARWICNRLWMTLTSSAHEEDYIGNTYYFSETFPSAGSFRTTWHIAQLGWAENAFRPYIFPSTEKNLRLYGRAVPRNYPLERITTPIFTYTGDSDVLVHPKDYRLVSRSVRSLVRRWRHPDPLFSHADFIFSRRSLVLYKQILRDMAGFFQ